MYIYIPYNEVYIINITIYISEQKISELIKIPNTLLSTVMISKRLGVGCFIINQKISDSLYDKETVAYVFEKKPYQLITLPNILKIDKSILIYLNEFLDKNLHTYHKDSESHQFKFNNINLYPYPNNNNNNIDLIFQFSPLSLLNISTK